MVFFVKRFYFLITTLLDLFTRNQWKVCTMALQDFVHLDWYGNDDNFVRDIVL